MAEVGSRTAGAAAAHRDLMDFREPVRPDEPAGSSSGRAGATPPSSRPTASLLDADLEVSVSALPSHTNKFFVVMGFF